MSKQPMDALDGVDIEAHYKEIDDQLESRKAEIKDKASYFVADVLSDGVVDNYEEVDFLIAIIETAAWHIAQKYEEKSKR